MKTASLLVALLPLTQAVRIVVSNDDGWAEINVRTLFNTLVAAGQQVILSAPAEGKSGTGSSDATPTKVDSDGCIFRSCPPNSPATGANATDPRLNYVNSFPVTSIKNGIDVTAPKLWSGLKPELAVTGPNVGSNVGIQVPFSGTVGAAVYAAKTAGIPALAFSGASGSPTAWTVSPPLYARVYADLALNLTSTVIRSGTPYLPSNTWLNINFPDVTSSKCSNAAQFKFVLTRINTGLFSAKDVQWCGTDRLPTESSIMGKNQCLVSVSVGDAGDKSTANAATQKVVLEKLRPILSCV